MENERVSSEMRMSHSLYVSDDL